MDGLTLPQHLDLPPELANFAAEALASGRYKDPSAFVIAALDLMRRVEDERSAFIASLQEAEAEGERDGFLHIDDVHRDMAAMLRAKVG